MDIKSKEDRSRNMAKIRARDTKPELFIRSELHKRSFRFRVNSDLIEGHPDIYFTKKCIALFIHGCYWHRHANCKYSYVPKSNVDYWMKKFENNIERDEKVMRALEEKRVRVIVIWECTVNKMMSDTSINEDYLAKIITFINTEEPHTLML